MFIKKITACLVSGCLLWNSAYASVALANKTYTKVEINAEAILPHSNGLREEMTRRLNDTQVLKELTKLGIKKSEVQMRLAAMSDQELQEVQQGVQRQVGGDVVIISLSTLILIILVILLLR